MSPNKEAQQSSSKKDAAVVENSKEEASKDKASPASKQQQASQQRLKPPPKTTTSAATAGAAASASAPSAAAPKPAASKGGLTDELLTQVAQQKFEAQEEKLKDIARHSISLMRDYSKLSASECSRKVSEIRKYVLKYEMQHVRVWELQEHTRRTEVAILNDEAKRCQEEAIAEGEKIPDLHQTLEKAKRRRKRYQDYEQTSSEINVKKSRVESKQEIARVTEEIEKLRERRGDLEAAIERRAQRAQLLRHAVADLALDLQREQSMTAEVLSQASPSTMEDPPAVLEADISIIS